MFVWFAAPRTYTGEEMVEIHAHGNPAILDAILTQCVHAGARLAEPGEFTRRAFLNGKLDLAEAEAVADLIGASSARAAQIAAQQRGGALSRVVDEALRELTELRARVEATIDFPEEDIDLIAAQGVNARLTQLSGRLQELRSSYRVGRVYREGARVVLLGAPNVGKSSLFNALLGESRALVHDLAGTTRDFLEQTVVWDGVPIHLIDTAGLRELENENFLHEVGQHKDNSRASVSERPVVAAEENNSHGEKKNTREHAHVESLGIARARELASNADLRVMVFESHRMPSSDELAIFETYRHEPLVIFCNKSDVNTDACEKIQAHCAPLPCIRGSARTRDGVENLQRAMLHKIRGEQSATSETSHLLTNRRHVDAVDRALAALEHAATAITTRLSAEFIAEDLRIASDALGEIVGTVTTDALLTEIFGKFCLGK